MIKSQIILIFALAWLAMIAIGCWESSVEGKNAWGKGKLGWKLKYKKRVLFTYYHFWLFIVMIPAFLAIPLVLNYSVELLGVLLSAYFSGLVVEDFTWFVVNPVFPLRKFNSKNAKWHIWLKIGKFEFPYSYIIGIILAILSWFLLWR